MNEIILATASQKSIASMQLMDKLVKAGVRCPCHACEDIEHIISTLCDWEHPNDDARKLKNEIGKGAYPSFYILIIYLLVIASYLRHSSFY